jgi:hypothetical protein
MLKLFVSLWHDAVPARNAELAAALDANRKVFDAIYVICDHGADVKPEPPIAIAISSENRPSTREMFDLMRSVPGGISVLANADIAFDQTIRLTERNLRPGQAWALSRWENGKIYNHRDSQDVWVFRDPIPPMNDKRLDAPLGMNGIDNALLDIMRREGKLTVTNPSLTVRCNHLHASGVRHDRRPDGHTTTIVSSPYQFEWPTTLNGAK